MNSEDVNEIVPFLSGRSVARDNRGIAVEVVGKSAQTPHLARVAGLSCKDDYAESEIGGEQVANMNRETLGSSRDLEGLEAGANQAF